MSLLTGLIQPIHWINSERIIYFTWICFGIYEDDTDLIADTEGTPTEVNEWKWEERPTDQVKVDRMYVWLKGENTNIQIKISSYQNQTSTKL